MAGWNDRHLPHPLLAPWTDDFGPRSFGAIVPHAVEGKRKAHKLYDQVSSHERDATGAHHRRYCPVSDDHNLSDNLTPHGVANDARRGRPCSRSGRLRWLPATHSLHRRRTAADRIYVGRTGRRVPTLQSRRVLRSRRINPRRRRRDQNGPRRQWQSGIGD